MGEGDGEDENLAFCPCGGLGRAPGKYFAHKKWNARSLSSVTREKSGLAVDNLRIVKKPSHGGRLSR